MNAYLSKVAARSSVEAIAPGVDWWNADLQNLKDKVDRVRKLKNKCKNPSKLFILGVTLKELNIIYKKKIVRAKLLAWRQLVQESTAWGRPYKFIFAKNRSINSYCKQKKRKNYR